MLGGVAGPVDATHSFAATIMTVASTIPDDQDDAVVLADSARLIRDTIGGFIMLEDMAWPATPSGAFLRTGIYIEGTVPITMCQWAWVHRAQGGQRHLITATATSTTDHVPLRPPTTSSKSSPPSRSPYEPQRLFPPHPEPVDRLRRRLSYPWPRATSPGPSSSTPPATWA